MMRRISTTTDPGGSGGGSGSVPVWFEVTVVEVPVDCEWAVGAKTTGATMVRRTSIDQMRQRICFDMNISFAARFALGGDYEALGIFQSDSSDL
jgi:hypothetical protein